MARPITYDPDDALDRALDLFWTRGYRGVSVEDIVQHTGLNRHSLYARFGNKRGLLTTTLERYCEAVIERLVDVLDAGGTTQERLRRALALRQPGSPAEPLFDLMRERGCFALRMSYELRNTPDEVNGVADRLGTTIERLFGTVIRRGQDAGEVRNDQAPDALAVLVTSSFVQPFVYRSRAASPEALLAALG